MLAVFEETFIDFAMRLPRGDREEHLERLKHCEENGDFIVLFEDGRIQGYGEVYKMEKPPQYPVWPYPTWDSEGKYLYCYAAVCRKGLIKKLMRLGRDKFPECEFLCYHRDKNKNRLYVVRMENL